MPNFHSDIHNHNTIVLSEEQARKLTQVILDQLSKAKLTPGVDSWNRFKIVKSSGPIGINMYLHDAQTKEIIDVTDYDCW